MDARREKVFIVPAGPDDDESQVVARAVRAAAEEWGVERENLKVELPLQWHGPVDNLVSEQPAVDCYGVTVVVPSGQ